MLRSAFLAVTIIVLSRGAFAATAILGPSSDPDSSLRAVKSSVRAEPGKGPGGARAFAWTGVSWNSRLDILGAGPAAFRGADRIQLVLHPGTMSGKVVHVIATDDLEKRYDAFSFPVSLAWDSWKSVEVPLLRFVRSGQALWQNMTSLCIEFQGAQGGDLMISSVNLLFPDEDADAVPGFEPPRPARDPLVLATFEDGFKSLNAWDARGSVASLSRDVYQGGRAAISWSQVIKGSALEFIEGPVSLEGFDTFRAWIRTEQPLSGLHVAFGNDPRRFAHAPVPPLSRGWTDVIIPFTRFKGADSVRLGSVEHVVFLYEGPDSAALVIDDVVFYHAGVRPQPSAPADPAVGPTGVQKPSKGVVYDASGNAVIRGRGVSVQASASGSRTGSSSEAWYARGGNPALRWFEIGESSEIGFSNLPEDVSGFRAVAVWLYSDSPTGELEIALTGHRGEGVTKVDVNWIGWKRLELPMDSFRGLFSAGRIEHLSFRFGADRPAGREFFFDDIALLAK